MTSQTAVTTIQLDKMTKAQFNVATKDPTHFYVITDEPVDGLPDQAGNDGKFLTTNGTTASWDVALKNTATNSSSLTILGTPTSTSYNVNIGFSSSATTAGAVAIGYGSSAGAVAVAVGAQATASQGNSIAIGRAQATGYASIQIGKGTNSEPGTLSIGLWDSGTWTNYKLLGSNGKIPNDRLTISTTMSSSSTDNEIPSTKLLYDTVGNIEALLAAI